MTGPRTANDSKKKLDKEGDGPVLHLSLEGVHRRGRGKANVFYALPACTEGRVNKLSILVVNGCGEL